MGNPNHLEINAGDDTQMWIDISLSMKEADCPNGMQRIEYLKEQTISFIEAASKYDTNGVDVGVFGIGAKHLGALTPAQARDAIMPLTAKDPGTDTAAALRAAWKIHKAKTNEDQTVCFIATDGAPSDREDTKKALREIGAQQDAGSEEFSVSFLVVGEPNADLKAFLDECDNTLNAKDKNGKDIDFVDWKYLDKVNFLEAWVGAVHD